MGVKERKEREFKRREEEILETAHQLLCNMEPQKMTMELIAEKAEIGRGTLYKHFKSKDEIYAHLMLRRRKKFIQRLKDINQEEEEKILKLVRSYMEYCLIDPQDFAVHKRCEQHCLRSNLGQHIINALDAQQNEKIKLIDQILQTAIGKNTVNTDDLSYYICAGWGMQRGAIDALLENRFGDVIQNRDKYFKTVEQMLLGGLPAIYR